VSYEVSMGFVIVTVMLCVGSLNLTDVVMAQRHVWFCLPLFPMFIIFFISTLAETNRSPFDLPEGESEIVAGFFVEYSSLSFGLFFLGEYANMILMSALTTILFLGGWLGPFGLLPQIGPLWFILKILPALPLRPADAAGLESVPAVLADLAGADRRRPAAVRLAAGSGVMDPLTYSARTARRVHLFSARTARSGHLFSARNARGGPLFSARNARWRN
jgi:hypothetical protein